MIYIVGLILIYLCKLSCSKMLVITHRSVDFSRKVCIYVAFTILFIISALRGYDVGIDTQNYATKFRIIQEYSLGYVFTNFYTERVEFGYAIICRVLGMVFKNPRIMIIVSSAIVNYGMARYIYRYTESDVVGVVLYICSGVFLHSLNITRQVMACVMLMNAWGSLTHKKYAESISWFFVGFSFHVTSIVFAVSYFFYFCRYNKKVMGWAFSISMVLAVLFKPIIRIASLVVDTFSYLDNSQNRVSAGGLWAVWIVELLIATYFVLSYSKSRKMRIHPDKGKKPIECEEMICIPFFVVFYIDKEYTL